MTTLNDSQRKFLNRMVSIDASLASMIGQVRELIQEHDEIYDTGQALDLNDLTDLFSTYGFAATNVATTINQGYVNFLNFWDGNAVTTREYGKDIRRVQ